MLGEDHTTIALSRKNKEKLDNFKKHERESYDSVVARLIETKKKLEGIREE